MTRSWTLSPGALVAAFLLALQLSSREAFCHGGGLHAWNFSTASHEQLPHKKLARCSAFNPYEADLATSSVAPLQRTSSLQLGLEGSIDVYVYLDTTCRMTSALLPSLKFWAAEMSGPSTAGDKSGSGLAEQHQQRIPTSHMHTSAYGFRGVCESGLVGVYQHQPLAGYNRNNILHWRDVRTDEEGGLHGIAPSGANTYPRQSAPHMGSSEGTAHEVEQDPAALSTSALQSILLVPSEGPLFCCNLHWEDEHGQPSSSAAPSGPLAAAREACMAASPSPSSSSSSSSSSAAGAVSSSGEAGMHGQESGSAGAEGIEPRNGERMQGEGELQERSQVHLWYGGVSADSEQMQMQPAGELQQGLQLHATQVWGHPQQTQQPQLQQTEQPQLQETEQLQPQQTEQQLLQQTEQQHLQHTEQPAALEQQEQQQQEQQVQQQQQQQQEQQQELAPVEQQLQRRRQLTDRGLVSPPEAAAPAPDRCLDTPAAPECATYEYPAERIQQDLDALCSAMPDMPGCSVLNACQAHKLTDEHICDGMVLLATLCEDMPGMSGCRAYNTMCGEGSVIQECQTRPPIKRTPSWSESRQAMFDMCADHPMQQCESCTKFHCPDPLASLSGACIDMPDMPECAMFDRWCQANGKARLAYYCGQEGGGSSSGLPSMLMYFHRRVSETVLWRSWVPKTYAEYACTIAVVILFGITSIGVKTCVSMLSMWWKVQASYEHMPLNSYPLSTPPSPPCAPPSLLLCWLPHGPQWWQNAIKATISAISITLDYWNMLIAMTFNVGLFCAVIVGYLLGAFIFASVPDNFAAYLQVVTPPNVFVDCECPKPTAYYATYAGTDDGEEGSKDVDPLNPKPAQRAKACSKAPAAAQGDAVTLLASRGGDIEAAPKRIIHCGGGDTYTTPSCCPGLD